MEISNVLVTETGSLLGFKLVELFLAKGKKVWGIGKISPPEEVLRDPNFTFLDINLAQPLSSHLPHFDLICHLLSESTETLTNFTSTKSLTPATNRIILQAQNTTKVILMAPIFSSENLYDRLAKDENIAQNLSVFLVGDIYGPGNPAIKTSTSYKGKGDQLAGHFYACNELINLISQAIYADKVILEDEGLRIIFPTYIDDALKAIESFVESLDKKNVRIIVSEPPKTSLNCAYEIAKIARLSFNRELKLYFSGPKKDIKPQPHPVIHQNSLGFSPEVELAEGLKRTLDFYKKENLSLHEQNQEPATSELQPVRQQKFKKFTVKIPTFQFGFNTKRIVVAIIIILILVIAKTGLDLYLGVSSLKSAKKSLSAADFKSAEDKAELAAGSFKAAASKLKILTLPFSLIVPGATTATLSSVASAELASEAFLSFIKGSQSLAQDLKIIVSANSQDKPIDIETASANLKVAYLKSTRAYQLTNIARKKGFLFESQLDKASFTLKDLANLSASTLELVNFIEDLVGTQDAKIYLILLQNNMELRPGGGFIGNFGLVKFEGGKLKDISVEDIYTIDGQLKEEIDPPPQLSEKLGVEKLFLRDSNWSLDFGVNAATARDFYRKETGKDVDGVIALDLTFIQNFLRVVGPVKLADYNEEITAENLFEKGLYYSEVGFFPGSSQKRDFFSTLTRTLISKITKGLSEDTTSGNIPWFDLINESRKALAEKHLMLTFDNENLSTLVKTKAWNNPLPPVYFDTADDSLGTRDVLALSEANLGANKANRFLERKIDYEMTIGRDANLVAKLKITYANTAQADTWPAGTYVNFLRVYTPFASGLLDFRNGQSSNLKEVEVTQEGNLTVFSTFVEVGIKQSKTIEFTYRIPKNIKLEQAPTYHLLVQKQPGTLKDPLTFTFNLPGYIKIKSANGNKDFEGDQNFRIETDLSHDRQFEIEVVKK